MGGTKFKGSSARNGAVEQAASIQGRNSDKLFKIPGVHGHGIGSREQGIEVRLGDPRESKPGTSIVIPEKPVNPDQHLNPNPMETQETPREEYTPPAQNPSEPGRENDGKPERKRKGSLIGGLVLITLGAIFLADEFLPSVDFGDLWPLILVVIGAGLLINTFTKNKPKNE